ncbi:right-handed parallel beta-helix repeat-containing protein [Candidatus Sumerlaeota bacterium]|nr:right-handed parallel beta-helix repeat-containing protein [Candidatus Sumerlaeota bacterium]
MSQVYIRTRFFPLFILFMFPLILPISGENTGKGESPEEHRANFLGDVKISPFPAMEGNLAAYSETQVNKRAKALGIDEKAVYHLAKDFPMLYREISSGMKYPSRVTPFNETKFSDLNALIREKGNGSAIRVEKDALEADKPLEIVSADCHIDFRGAEIKSGGIEQGFGVYIRRSRNVTISGLILHDFPDGIFITESENIRIRDCGFERTKGNPVLIAGDVRNFMVEKSRFYESGRAGVIVESGVICGIIQDNEFDSGRSFGNHEAGILLTDKGIYNIDQKVKFPERIHDRTKPAQKIIILHNAITNNMSSGIYCDGGVLNFMIENRITGNSKEGVCLDSGSTGNIFYGNAVKFNGKRYGQTDRALEADFVLGHGRLADGCAAAKLPGISIDNAMYNMVVANIIQDNYGGGVKMVRTGINNLVAMNTIINNNEGASDKFHFFGIEMGAARADVPCGDLDFMASSGNIITGNMIYGDHYAGIFLGDGSIMNRVKENIIQGATHWAVESVKEQENEVSGNLSDCKSLNIKPLQ